MFRDENTPTRSRTIQEAIYEDAGISNHSFNIPTPFTAAMFTDVGETVGANATGLANQMNQVLAENLGNNMASRIKKAAADSKKAHGSVRAEDLPAQDDMDKLYDSYDFTGIRASAAASGSLFDRIMFRISSALIRKLIKDKGYRDMPAPVTVARRGADAADGQIDYETFESEVLLLVDGEGPWGENQAMVDLRQALLDQATAEEEQTKAAAAEAEKQLAEVSLG